MEDVEIPPRDPALVHDYVLHVGGAPGAYGDELPFHLMPQWAFPALARTLRGLPYPMERIVNGGCRFEVNRPIPMGTPLHVRAYLDTIDDDGERAVLVQRVVTETEDAPNALVAELRAVIPLARGMAKGRKERPPVPASARELCRLDLSARAGLDFAKLTGDFNPIHWIPAAARASGLRACILQGFSTVARTLEALYREELGGDVHAVATFEARLTRPLPLPARPAVFVDQGSVFVADAIGEVPYLAGSYEVRT
jgi:hypothetical protein